MADLQGVFPHDDTLDEQLQDPLPLGQGRALQPRPDALTERRQLLPDFPGLQPLLAQPRLLVPLGHQAVSRADDLLGALFQLRQVDALLLVGVEQALLLTVEPLQLRLPLLLLGLAVSGTAGAPASSWALTWAAS